jgi:transcriptional regulator with XRE-family HTH domain
MLTNEQFGARLKAQRNRLGLTQAGLAKSLGIQPVTQYSYEKGVRTPNAEYLIKASQLGVNIHYLFRNDQDNLLSENSDEADELIIHVLQEAESRSRDSKGRLLDFQYRAQKILEKLNEKFTLSIKP